MRLIYIFLFLICSFPTIAQQTIMGIVTDAENGNPLSNVQIVIRKDRAILQYTHSDKIGEFSIKKSSTPETLLTFSHVGYKNVEMKVADITDRVRIKLYPQSFTLHEVTIKAPKIRAQGDTITYYVEQFSSDRDKTIGDVLKKMPGIDIDTKGKITYNGKSINKFYIEGQDLLGGKYGIAVNGIPQQDVGRIEVYEDHQPIRALEGLHFSDQAAINIKLKDDAKAHWIATIEAGGGLPMPLWEAKLFAMCIKDKYQNITVLKSNNSGHDLSRECETVTAWGIMEGSNPESSGQFFNVSLPTTPYLSAERTLDNRSHLFSSNQLWGLKNNHQLKAQINYLNDKTQSEASSETVYYLPGEENIFLKESKQGTACKNILGTNLTINGNKENYYLNNSFNTEWKWDKTDLATLNDANDIKERAKLPTYQLSNNFQLVKRINQHALSLYSFTLLQSASHELDIYNDEEAWEQSVFSKYLFNNNYASYSFAIKNWVLSLTGGISFFLHDMESELYKYTSLPDVLASNDVSTSYISTYLTPKLEWNKKVLIFTLQCPVNYYHYNYKNSHSTQKKDFCYYSPAFRVQYNITPDLEWNMNGGLSQKKPDVFSWYDNVIMQNYRNLKKGYVTMQPEANKSLSSNLSYKNLAWILFANLHMSFQWNKHNYIDNRDFEDNNLTNHSTVPQKYNSRLQTSSARISKGIDIINGTASVKGLYYAFHSQMSQQERLIPYGLKMHEISGNVNGQIKGLLDWEYDISYSKNKLDISENELSASERLSHKITTDCHFGKKLTFRTVAEYYRNEISENTFKNTFFLDASITYKVNKKFEVSLNADNLFNHVMYDYILNSSLSTYISKQSIRGRNIFINFFYQL